MNHNTKFENKMFDGLEAIIWTNINILTLRNDLDPEFSNPFFSLGTLASPGHSVHIRPRSVAKESTVQIIY